VAIWLVLQVDGRPGLPSRLNNAMRLGKASHGDFLGPWDHQGLIWLAGHDISNGCNMPGAYALLFARVVVSRIRRHIDVGQRIDVPQIIERADLRNEERIGAADKLAPSRMGV
jgi:hypothetical protein